MPEPEAPVTSRTSLLDPAFVRELEALRRRLEIRARSGRTGEHLARRRGGAAEFYEHRPYAPGDDLRRIDWAAYARSGEPVVKIFRSEEDVVARLVLDASASLDFGEPSKLGVARRLGAAIGYMTLASAERAQLLVAGAGLRSEHAPARGRGGLPALLRHLDAVRPGGGTDLSRAIDAVVRQSARPGMLVVLSDFFDPGPVVGALARAGAAGHDIVLVQILAPEEVEPACQGDFALEDAETGAIVELTMDPAAIEAYALRLAGLCEELRAFARKHRATYVRVRTDEPLEEAVRRIVARSVD
ncbi:MAG: DUF58 domain-containing protein [Deltaproteobacteria bacterium]|nr:DUF58 domain-containing protein [Deltaproteobacteria bacterium]